MKQHRSSSWFRHPIEFAERVAAERHAGFLLLEHGIVIGEHRRGEDAGFETVRTRAVEDVVPAL